MSFISDTQVSEPVDSTQFTLDKHMNGFGWSDDDGLFIPVETPVDYIMESYPNYVGER